MAKKLCNIHENNDNGGQMTWLEYLRKSTGNETAMLKNYDRRPTTRRFVKWPRLPEALKQWIGYCIKDHKLILDHIK